MLTAERRRVTLGIERLCGEESRLIRGARVGLVGNQASVTHELVHAADLLASVEGVDLRALFGPQHGIRGDVQDNMVETPHDLDRVTGLPVYSLYSETREPTEEMLKELDVLVCDLQDVGCRIYTFVYTIANCMRVAGRLGKKVIVCDRPNPINGETIEGNLLRPEFASFVGQFPLPTRHGLTTGELARMFREHWKIECDLEVVRLINWERRLWSDETDVPWVMPSPNMPTLEAATVFPGTVHLEGTLVSEGRGTTRPFELVGAPYVRAEELARYLDELQLPGVKFRATYFLPTFQKHAGETCGGVQIHVQDRREFKPVLTGAAVVKALLELYPDSFQWKQPPYEYVYDRLPFDVIAGTDELRLRLLGGESLARLEEWWQADVKVFSEERERYLLY
jgi:uncharacterized protein YbbC (DUF1343 family)